MGIPRRERALVLCGMMGSGKSSVGRRLARRLGWEFIDTDSRIESTRGRSVAEIFSNEGEAVFRRFEREVLADLPCRAAVIALGGGTMLAEENRDVLRRKGTLVWIDAAPEVLAARIRSIGPRPLLAGLDREGRIERLRELRAEREAAYAEADLRVRTDECQSPEEACGVVLRALGWEPSA